MSSVIRLVNGPESENAYIVVSDNGQALLVDPGSDAQLVALELQKRSLQPMAIIATHAHWDHVSAVDALKLKYGIPFYIHQNELKLLKSLNLYRMLVAKTELVSVPKVDGYLVNHDLLEIGDFQIKSFLIGSHTLGSCFILVDNHLFTGDILYKGRLSDEVMKSDLEQLRHVVGEIASSDTATIVYPGHGSFSSLDDELMHNNDLLKVMA